MWKPAPSATSAKPIISRNASASIRVVGWRWMKPAMVPDAAYITATARMTATIITLTCSAMPMAVTIESMEKITSMTTICAMIGAEGGTGDLAERRLVLTGGLDVLVDLLRRLDQQEQTAGEQHEIAPRHAVIEDGEDRRGQPDQREQRREEGNAEDQRQRQPDLPRPLGLLLRQFADDDRDEHDVVDAEDDLEHGQRHEAGENGWIGDPRDDRHGGLRQAAGRVNWR